MEPTQADKPGPSMRTLGKQALPAGSLLAEAYELIARWRKENPRGEQQ